MRYRNTVQFLILLTLCLLLSACAKSEAVVNVESQIDSIGTVSEQSLREIENAERLYDALDEKEKGRVDNLSALEQARAEYNQLMSGKVDQLIDSIGTVSEQSLEKIKAAEAAYNALTDEQKALVTKYDALQAARDAFHAALVLKAETLIQEVQYSGEGEPDAALKSALEKAHQAYDALPAELRPLVSSYSHLAEVDTAVSQFYVDQAQEAIDAAIASDSDYAKANALYSELTSEQKAKISNYSEFHDCYIAYINRPPVKLISCTLKKNSIGNPELYLKAKNTSDKIVKEFSATVFAFDGDGIPVSVYFGDYSTGIRYSSAIKVGASTKSNSYWTLYGTYSEMKQIVVILREVEFFDGTVWENSQYGTLYEKYEQQLLAEGDKNVLPRG